MKTLNVKSLTEKLIPAATIAVGFAAAKAVPAIVGKVYKPAGGLSNTIIGISEVVAGVFLSTMKNKHVSNVGLGIAVSGIHTFLAAPIKKGLDVAGLGAYGNLNYRPNMFAMGNNGIGCENGVRNVAN